MPGLNPWETAGLIETAACGKSGGFVGFGGIGLEKSLESFTVYTTSPPGFTPEARASVVDVDAEEGVGCRKVKYLSPGVIASFLLDGARIVVDRRDENLGAVRIAGQRFGIVKVHQHCLARRAGSIEAVGERWLRWCWACEG